MSLLQLFGQDQRLAVPIFQRPYVWSEDKNWRPLWEDVASLVQRKLSGGEVHRHFLGAVVLDQLTTPTGSMPARQVIDGQQRLTTLQVVLAAIRDVARDFGAMERYVKALTKLTANDDDMTDEDFALYKVWPTHIDRSPFRSIMDGDMRLPVDSRGHHASGAEEPALIRAYRYFHRQTTQWAHALNDERRLDAGFDAIVRVLREKFELIVIDLKPHDNAQVIFEALNDRGTPLQASDLVKNLVFQAAEEQNLPVEELHRSLWSRLETRDWRLDVRQGRLKRPRLDVFLTQYLTSELVREVPTPELFLTFRQLVRDGEPGGLRELVQHVVDQADTYDRLTAEEQPDTAEGRFLRNISALDVNTVVPVLLWLVTRFDEDARRDAVGALDSYLVRRTVCRRTTKNYNRLFLELLKELKNADDPAIVTDFLLQQDADSGYWPSDTDILQVFRSQPLYRQLTQARLRLVLAELEDAQYSGKTERLFYKAGLTVEHLLPQSWEARWPLPPTVPSTDGENAREHRQNLLHTIGNLTLLTSKLNPALSNGPWADKRTEILKHSALALNRSLPEKWDEGAILARADELTETFCTRWPRPTSARGPSAGIPQQSTAERNTDDAPGTRGDAGRHLREVFASLPVGAVLTVPQIVAARTSQFEAGEISSKTVRARLRNDDVPGVQRVSGTERVSARKTG